MALVSPPLMKQPAARWISKGCAHVPKCFAADETQCPPERTQLGLIQIAAPLVWIDLRPPEDLIRHPVPDSRESRLQEQDAFERKLRVPRDEPLHIGPLELV